MDRLLFTPTGAYEPPFVMIYLHGDVPDSLPSAKVPQPASLLICRQARYAPDLNVGSIEHESVVLYARGESEKCLLVLIDHWDHEAKILTIEKPTICNFVEEAATVSVELGEIASGLFRGLEKIDEDLNLIRKSNGRWINKGKNFFTLKVQNRKKNFQFTIYGDPASFDHDEFLKKDQNSYSRGWIHDQVEAKKFLTLAKASFDRRR